MKSTGIVRRVDELGRVVLPIELRNKFEITEKDPLEIFVDGSSIILKKVQDSCVFCGKGRQLKEYKGRMICEQCLKEMKEVK